MVFRSSKAEEQQRSSRIADPAWGQRSARAAAQQECRAEESCSSTAESQILRVESDCLHASSNAKWSSKRAATSQILRVELDRFDELGIFKSQAMSATKVKLLVTCA